MKKLGKNTSLQQEIDFFLIKFYPHFQKGLFDKQNYHLYLKYSALNRLKLRLLSPKIRQILRGSDARLLVRMRCVYLFVFDKISQILTVERLPPMPFASSEVM